MCENQQKQQTTDLDPQGLQILELLDTDSKITPNETFKEIMKKSQTWTRRL